MLKEIERLGDLGKRGMGKTGEQSKFRDWEKGRIGENRYKASEMSLLQNAGNMFMITSERVGR